MERMGTYRSIAVALLLVFGLSCSRLARIKRALTSPTAREQYEQDYREDPAALALWKSALENALKDSIQISLPYAEKGRFFVAEGTARNYGFHLKRGERLILRIKKNLPEELVFLDLYSKDSTGTVKKIHSSPYGVDSLVHEVQETGLYKVIVQPEISAYSLFELTITKKPIYRFPVATQGNQAVQSFWGASRDGGRRSHEGVDIFAPRGTPVLAVTEAIVSSTANRGLGGKQVWLRDRKRKLSLYYAHLDSITIHSGRKVFPGDTLGLVGNTGNARTTPPHLHFSIYSGFRGALDPYPYIAKTKEAADVAIFPLKTDSVKVRAWANLRKGPSLNAEIVRQAEPMDTSVQLGVTDDWVHGFSDGDHIFIHESLVRDL